MPPPERDKPAVFLLYVGRLKFEEGQKELGSVDGLKARTRQGNGSYILVKVMARILKEVRL